MTRSANVLAVGIGFATIAGCGDDAANNVPSTSAASVTQVAGTGADPATEAASSPKPCEEVYADDVVFESAEQLSATYCDRDDGAAYLPGSATQPCPDGRVLYWNDEGWGYLGEPFHRHAPGAEKVAPDAERTACIG
jgi:hypothetical protein